MRFLNRLQVLARQPNVQPPVLAKRSIRVSAVTRSFALAARGGLPLAALHGVKQLLFFSIKFIVGLLTEVLLRRLPARDDRLQEDRVLVLHEGHQVHIFLALDDENALASITVGVRIFQNVEEFATLDMKGDVLGPDATLRPELRIPRVVPVEVQQSLNTTCAY